MKTKLLALFCALVLLCGTMPTALALEGETTRAADTLSVLGLVRGTTGGDYALSAPATRAQAAVLLVRLAGAEDAAKLDPWFAGFRDVPVWATDAVDYAAHQGWMTGVTVLDFNASAAIDARDWFSSLLRMLGYGEEDFLADDAAAFARRIGLSSLSYDGALTRGDLFLSLRDALTFSYRDGSGTVLDRLMQLGLTSRAAANATGLLTPELTARQIADRCTAAVFRLDGYHTKDEVDTTAPSTSASGFFISKDGIAVTNYHSIDGAIAATATLVTGETYPVENVLYYDVGKDLAVLQISRRSTDHRSTSAFAALEIAPSGTDDLRAGDTVFAIGNPLGLGLAVSSGVVSDMGRIVARYDLPCIMDTADISQGSSGGALLNAFGQVVGVTSGAYAYGNNMYLAVPIDPILTVEPDGGRTLSELVALLK